MEYEIKFIIFVCEEMLKHPEWVIVRGKPEPNPRFKNVEWYGSLEIVVNGLTFEIHQDHWELWDFSTGDNVVPEYSETDSEIVEKIREVVKMMTADPKIAETIGFTDIEI